MRLDHTVTVVGAHAEGEVGRVIVGGVLPPPGDSMFQRMQNLEAQSPSLRSMLLFDPRGSVNAAVNLITPPVRSDADIGMIVMESDYFPPMSGSNLICTVTVALETGLLQMREPETMVRVDTAAGLVEVRAACHNGKCRRVSFRNVPSFVMHQDRFVEVAGVGTLRVDVAYGGMIYCLVEAGDAGLALERGEARAIVALGERIKEAAAEQLPSVHPENAEINRINQVCFTGPLGVVEGVKASTNAVVVSPGRLDRCPCGTGTSVAPGLPASACMASIRMIRFRRAIDWRILGFAEVAHALDERAITRASRNRKNASARSQTARPRGVLGKARKCLKRFAKPTC